MASYWKQLWWIVNSEVGRLCDFSIKSMFNDESVAFEKVSTTFFSHFHWVSPTELTWDIGFVGKATFDFALASFLALHTLAFASTQLLEVKEDFFCRTLRALYCTLLLCRPLDHPGAISR